MKIGLVYDAVYPWVKGGGEKHLWELAVALRRRGHDVHCFGMQFWDGDRSIERDGVWLHGVCRARQLYDATGRRSRLQPLIFAAGLFVTLLRNPAGKLDVIDSIAFPYFSLFAIAAWRRLTRNRVPWIITWLEVWGTDYWRRYLGDGLAACFGAWVERRCSGLGDRHVSISRHQALRLSSLLGVPATDTETIPRGIHLGMPGAALQDPCRILYIGRLLAYKNVEVILRAMPAVLAQLPAATFRIVGAGPTLKSLREETIMRALSDAVHFVAPHADASDALREIQAASILVQPSTREGQSVVVLEAQALGVPVIAARHADSAVSEFVDSGRTGLLVDGWDNPATWASAIVTLLTDEPLRERLRTAGQGVAREYDWNMSIAPRIEALYEKVRLNIHA